MAGAGYKLFTAGAVLTAAEVNTYLEQQTIMVFATTAARDTALNTVKAEGMLSSTLDDNTLDVYTGSAWSSLIAPAWGAGLGFTPTLTQSATVTKTTAWAAYQRIGRWIHGTVTLTVTGSGTASNAVVVGLPVAAANSQFAIGQGSITNASPAEVHGGILNLTAATTANFVSTNGSAGALGAVAPFTEGLAAGDTVTYSFGYWTDTDA